MVDITEISAIVAAVGVLVGVAYYILDMRNQGKMRQMDFIMRMPSFYLTKEMIQIFAVIRKTEFKNFDDFEEKCGVEARQVADFYEVQGLFVKRKIVDISLVADRFDVSSRYEKLRPWIVERRKRDNNPRLYEWFEYLANEEKKYYQQLVKDNLNTQQLSFFFMSSLNTNTKHKQSLSFSFLSSLVILLANYCCFRNIHGEQS